MKSGVVGHVRLWLHVVKVNEISFNSFNMYSTRDPKHEVMCSMSNHKQPFVPGLDGNIHEL